MCLWTGWALEGVCRLCSQFCSPEWGLAGLTGYPDTMPTEFMGSDDIKSAFTTADAIMTALIYRQRTGEGQYIDLSSTEAIAACCGINSSRL